MNQHAGTVGGDDAKTVEVHARTVDEAVARGLVRLGGLSRSEVEIEVIHEGRVGLLGFGNEDAVVRLRVRAAGPTPVRPEPDIESPARVPSNGPSAEPSRHPRRKPQRDEPETAGAGPAPSRLTVGPPIDPETRAEAALLATGTTRRYLRLLGYDDIAVEEGAALVPNDVEDEASLVLNVRSEESHRLLARDGRPLLALQFLVRLAVNRQTGTWVNLLLDVDGDRARRVKELFSLAEQSADLVDRDGRPVSLPPMTAYERRVVHLALKDHPSVTTQSIGRGEARKVTVRLKGQELPGM